MSFELRPTFSLGLDEPTGVVLRRLRERMQATGVEVRWARRPGGGGPASTREDGDHVVLCIATPERHFWSPWLMVDISQQDGGTHVYGRFSPHPSVWTGYAFCYLTLTAIGFFSLIFAWASQLSGSGKPWVGLLAPVCGLIALVMWWVSQVGQRLARGEMVRLRACLDAAVAAPEAAPAGVAVTLDAATA